MSGRRKEFDNTLKLAQGDWRLDFPKRYEGFYIGLEYWTLVPWAERLINVRIDTAGGNVANKISCSTVQCIDKQGSKYSGAVLF